MISTLAPSGAVASGAAGAVTVKVKRACSPGAASRNGCDAGVTVLHRPSGRSSPLAADRVVVVGERRPVAGPDVAAGLVLAVGDAVVPRRAAHAIAEGRAAAARIAGRRKALLAFAD